MAHPGPRHEEISNWVLQQIEDGDLSSGGRLPSEHDLCDHFGVSRITVRRALHTLEAAGRIIRRQGVGSFVAESNASAGARHLLALGARLREEGLRPAVVVTHDEQDVPAGGIARTLRMKEGVPARRVDRLWKGNGAAVAFEQNWFPPFVASLLRGDDVADEQLYERLSGRYDLHAPKTRMQFEAVNAPNEVTQHLDVPWGRALLAIRTTLLAASDRPICVQIRYYRSDRAHLVASFGTEGDDAHPNPDAFDGFSASFD